MTSTGGPALVPTSTPGPYAWEIVRYQQARWALASRCLSKDPHLAREASGEGHFPARDTESEEGCILNLANSDPPSHTRLRRLLAKALTPERMRRMQPRITRAAGILADRMVPARRVDLIRSFIFPLQVTVTCELLGIPPHHRCCFRSLAAAMRAPADSNGPPESCQEAYRRTGVLVGEALTAKRGHIRLTGSPDLQPDLLSALVESHVDSDSLTAQETQSMAMLLISAGQEPTIDLIANGMLSLLLHPDQLRLFRRHPELRPQAVEELLRYEAPVSSAPRIAAEDIEIDGTVVRRRSMIAVMLERAHRDPLQFREPDAFDITRRPNGHLAFGHGIHYCIGAPLARLQASLALTTLATRFPHMTLAHPSKRPRWHSLPGRRGLVELPVALGPRETGRRGADGPAA